MKRKTVKPPKRRKLADKILIKQLFHFSTFSSNNYYHHRTNKIIHEIKYRKSFCFFVEGKNFLLQGKKKQDFRVNNLNSSNFIETRLDLAIIKRNKVFFFSWHQTRFGRKKSWEGKSKQFNTFIILFGG
jgi:hypothetical protein